MCTNHSNLPNLHIKVPTILLIAFCGKFCNFCKIIMPKLLSRSKQEEFKSNSALQIKDQKERRAKCEEKWSTVGVLLPLPLCILRALCIQQPVLLHFTLLLFLLQFFVFLLSTLVVITYVLIVWYFTWFVRLYKPFVYTVRGRFFCVNKIKAPGSSRFSLSLIFFFIFSLAKHPLRMTTRRMSG